MNNTQGSIQKMKDVLMKPMDRQIEAKNAGMDQLEQAARKAQEQGIPFEQFLKAQLGGQQGLPQGQPGQPGQPRPQGAPGGQPPRMQPRQPAARPEVPRLGGGVPR